MPKRTRLPVLIIVFVLIALFSTPVFAAAPSNDASASALALNLPAFGAIVDIEEATLQAGEQPASCAVGGNDDHSVWFRVTAPTGTLRFETTTNNAGFDTVIAIYPTPEFLSFPNLVETACAVNPGGAATLELDITGGSYLIRVAADDTASIAARTLNFSVLFTPPSPALIPANDDIATPRAVVFNKASRVVNWEYATDDPDDPETACAPLGPSLATLWYTFTGTGELTLVTVEGSVLGLGASGYVTNAGVAVFTGSPGSLSEVDCDTVSGFQQAGRLTISAAAGVNYYVMVYHKAVSFMTSPSVAKLLVVPAAIDLTKNGNFDAGLTDWVVSNATGDGIVNDAGTPSSNNAFRFTGGAGENSQLKQTITIPAHIYLPANSYLRFFYTSKSQTALPPVNSIKFEFKLIYADGTVVKIRKSYTNPTAIGLFSFDDYTFLIARKNPVKIKFAIKSKATSGDVAFDGLKIRLSAYDVSRNAPSGVLPLPAGPAGR